MGPGWLISLVEIKIQNVGTVGVISAIFMKDTCVFKYLVYMQMLKYHRIMLILLFSQ